MSEGHWPAGPIGYWPNVGIVLIGGGCNALFYGIALGQAIHYFRHHFLDDRVLLQCLVIFMMCMSTAHFICYALTTWLYAIPLHGTTGVTKLYLPWPTHATIIVNSVAVFVLQTFFLRRIWTLGRNKIVTGVLFTSSLATFIMGLYYGRAPFKATGFGSVHAIKMALSSMLAATDVCTTGTLVFLLARTGKYGTRAHKLIRRLIFYTITTGMLTAICAVLALIMNIKRPDLVVTTMLYDLSVALYNCSFLASLNARQGLRHQLRLGDDASAGAGPQRTRPLTFAPVPPTESYGVEVETIAYEGALDDLEASRNVVSAESLPRAARQKSRDGKNGKGRMVHAVSFKGLGKRQS